ncbi:MAG: hypothetical protein ABW058_02810 [Methylobacterium sp.]
MRRLLLISLLAALAAVGLLAYQLVGRGGRLPETAKEQAAGNPVRSIPLRPRDGATPLPAPSGGGAAEAPSPDVLGDVSRTLDDLRTRDTTEGAPGPALTPAQVEALKAQAERRHVRPVTRMTFPLDPGTVVPAQVYLHPMPPELSGLGQASDPLGFIQVGDRFVLVGTVSRRIVAVAKG